LAWLTSQSEMSFYSDTVLTVGSENGSVFTGARLKVSQGIPPYRQGVNYLLLNVNFNLNRTTPELRKSECFIRAMYWLRTQISMPESAATNISYLAILDDGGAVAFVALCRAEHPEQRDPHSIVRPRECKHRPAPNAGGLYEKQNLKRKKISQ
jgi:hypothetical protein